MTENGRPLPEGSLSALAPVARAASRFLLGQIRLPTWAFLLLALFMGIPDWNSRVVFWLHVAENSGGFIGAIAALLLWPWSAVMLAAIALLLTIVFEIRNRKLAYNPVSVAFAWVSLVVCVVAIGGTTAYGAIQAYVEKEIALGIAGVPRRSASLADPARVQKPLATASRVLQPDQSRVLLQVLPSLRPGLSTLPIAYDWNDGEAAGVYQGFQSILSRSGIPTTPLNRTPSGPNETGFEILVGDLAHVPITAQRLKADLEMVNIYANFAQLESKPTAMQQPAILYIAPAPFL